MIARSRGPVSSFLFLALVFAGRAAGAEQATRKLFFDASDALERGMEVDSVEHADSSGGVVLYDSTLIEDDGPGIGPDASFLADSQRSPVIKVGGPFEVRKILHIDRPTARMVRLYTTQGVNFAINGTPIKTSPDDNYPLIPPELLRQGDNEIIVSCPADHPQTIKIARRADILRNAPDRKGRPLASFKSEDGGKTWQPIDGEAMVRLFLLQFRPAGSFASEVIDLRSEEGKPLARAPISVRSIALTPQDDVPTGTSITFQIRAGSTPVYEPAHWGDWRPVSAPIESHRRFIQWKAVLTSNDARTTPVLRGVALKAVVDCQAPPAWTKRLAVGSES